MMMTPPLPVVVDGEGAALRLVVQTQQARGTRQKVAGVVERVKGDDVGVEETSKDEVAVGERAENLRRRKRAVKEISAPHRVVSLAEKRG